MGKGGCNKEVRRIMLWMSWTINMLVTTIYYILSFVTSAALVSSSKELHIGISDQIWRAPIAAAVLGGILVLAFNLSSCLILLRNSIVKQGPGFGFGFIVAMCFTLSFFCLLCGIVLQGFEDVVKQQLEPLSSWSSNKTGAFIGTVAMAYICFVMFILFAICLLVFQGAVTKELGLAPPSANQYNKFEEAAFSLPADEETGEKITTQPAREDDDGQV